MASRAVAEVVDAFQLRKRIHWAAEASYALHDVHAVGGKAERGEESRGGNFRVHLRVVPAVFDLHVLPTSELALELRRAAGDAARLEGALHHLIHGERPVTVRIPVELRVLNWRRGLFPDVRPAERVAVYRGEGGIIVEEKQERGEQSDGHCVAKLQDSDPAWRVLIRWPGFC